MSKIIAVILALGTLGAGPVWAGTLDDRLRAETGGQTGPFTRIILAALSGDHRAEQAVGNAYEWGQGVRMDPAAALGWYRRAVGHGDSKAMVDLALLMQSGQAGAVDLAGAVTFFRRASLAGEADGSVRLAMAYEWGYGLERDPCEAAAQYRRAAAQGSTMAPLYLHLASQHLDLVGCDRPVS